MLQRVVGLKCWRFNYLKRGFQLAFFAVAALLGALYPLAAGAGTLGKEALGRHFPAPLQVGEKDAELPIWPIFIQDAMAPILAGYAFESIDLAPIPGFSGTPFNLLIAINPRGKFLAVKVLSQHEPVFLDGLGEEPLFRFVNQYKGLSLTQSIKIGSTVDREDNVNAHIDGVAKATASVRILNQTLLSSALKVARWKLGFAKGKDPDLVARIDPQVFRPLDWQALRKAGLISRTVFYNKDIEKSFAGTPVQGIDDEILNHPDKPFIELYTAHLNVPTVGRNLLPPAGWEYLKSGLQDGDHALLVIAKGRYSFLGENFVRGTVPGRLTLHQMNLPIEMQDFDLADSLDLFKLDYKLKLPEFLQDAEWRVFQVIAPAGLDPAHPLEFDLRVTRNKGWLYPEKFGKDFRFRGDLPEDYFIVPGGDDKTWHSIWTSRSAEIVVLIAALAILTGVLRAQTKLVKSVARLRYFRTGYLLFTLFFIGWYAQGQLSIVNITAAAQALVADRSLGFLLYDPMMVILWGFVFISVVWWGRGTFCGWLCPFGALQELLGLATKKINLPQIRVAPKTDEKLKWLKYGVLGAILAASLFSVSATDRLVEIEPFKTSITLLFDRSPPFVLWAAGILGFSLFLYKGFCRYLCPLGAGIAILGRFHLSNWIARRNECGAPCHRCRADCAYQAIDSKGSVHYDECFQCLDCVAIYESDTLCVPLILEKRKLVGRKPLEKGRTQ